MDGSAVAIEVPLFRERLAAHLAGVRLVGLKAHVDRLDVHVYTEMPVEMGPLLETLSA